MNSESPKPKRGFWQSFYRVLQLVVIGYLFIVVAVLIFQRRLLYFPTRLSPEAAVQQAAARAFAPWQDASGRIIGWKMPATGAATGSVLIVHGNAGCALDRDYLARPIHDAAAVDVYVLEYPGYGARAGSPSRSSLVAAVDAAFGLLPADQPKYVVGESLGTGVAAELAAKHPAQVAGLALFAPYPNLAAVAQKHFPILPAYFLLFDRFNPANALRNYHGPVEFVVAGADEVIAPGFGKNLFNLYDGPKELQVVAGAHHNEIAGQPADWWRPVFAFWQRQSGKANAAAAP
jgi:pimeloyl-ACP methyl ester carboxylesterase